MDYISQTIAKYGNEKKSYTINEIEFCIADIILNDAKKFLDGAIKQGYSCISMLYTEDSDGLCIQQMDSSEEYYLQNDWSKGFSCLGNLISISDKDRLVLRNEIFNNAKRLNLANIEGYVSKGFVSMGAKKVSVFIRFCENATVDVEKKNFLGKCYIKKELKLINKYKICYTVSW